MRGAGHPGHPDDRVGGPRTSACRAYGDAEEPARAGRHRGRRRRRARRPRGRPRPAGGPARAGAAVRGRRLRRPPRAGPRLRRPAGSGRARVPVRRRPADHARHQLGHRRQQARPARPQRGRRPRLHRGRVRRRGHRGRRRPVPGLRRPAGAASAASRSGTSSSSAASTPTRSASTSPARTGRWSARPWARTGSACPGRSRSIAEQHHDERGLVWPREVAPYDVHVVPVGRGDQPAHARDLAERLADTGLRVLVDDRDGARPGSSSPTPS